MSEPHYLIRRHTNDRLVNRDGSVLKVDGDYVSEVLVDHEERYNIDLEAMTVEQFNEKWGEKKAD